MCITVILKHKPSDFISSSQILIILRKSDEISSMSSTFSNSACIKTATYASNIIKLEMWANAQRDGRPVEYRWRPLFNAAVWLTPTTRLPCSNAAKDANPVEITWGAPN